MERSYLSVAEAIPLAGLRIAFTQGGPGPWGEAVKAFMAVKGIDYQAVAQIGGDPNPELQAWTGQNSAPCAVLDEERPRAHWSEILMLAERLAPEPRLIPADEEERMAMFGIAHELCGEDGFGWSARLIMLQVAEQGGAAAMAAHMRRKFASGAPLEHAAKRASTIMATLAARMERQEAAGNKYLVGSSLSAVDIYWTCFSNLIDPMAADICPMPDFYRVMAAGVMDLAGPVPPVLIRLRDHVARSHLDLPMWF